MAEVTRSENVLGVKWDRCLTDTSTKLAAGISLGLLFSLITKRKLTLAPSMFGAGVGLGSGYTNCQHDFRNPHLFHGSIEKVNEKH